jgi:hypothetical protein
MAEPTDADVLETAATVERRDDTMAQVREHAGRIAHQLALLDGGDYGTHSFTTDGGEWTLKYEAGDVEYLRFEPRSGTEIYAVSSKQPPEPDALATALDDYPAFVEAYNDHVASLDGVLDGVDAEFPAVASTDLVAERDRIVARIRDVADAMAGELHRYDGSDYGTFAARVDGKRWELKREESRASYLRVGGEGGVYLLSQYAPPSAADVRQYADAFGGFVEAFNEHVRELNEGLSEVSL